MKNYSVLDKLVPQTEKLHRDIFDNGYDQGYEDCIADTKPALERLSKKVKEAYNNGMNDACECARKICTNWCISDEVLVGIFGRGETIDNIMQKYTALEAIDKIKAYEEKQNEQEITVGDEVYFIAENHPRVVTCIFCENGDYIKAMQVTESGKWVIDDIRELHKTGRHFDQIEEVLKQMKEG